MPHTHRLRTCLAPRADFGEDVAEHRAEFGVRRHQFGDPLDDLLEARFVGELGAELLGEQLLDDRAAQRSVVGAGLRGERRDRSLRGRPGGRCGAIGGGGAAGRAGLGGGALGQLLAEQDDEAVDIGEGCHGGASAACRCRP